MIGETFRNSSNLSSRHAPSTRGRHWLSALFTFLTFAVLMAWAPEASAYTQYSISRSAGFCADCHGGFRDNPYISPKGDNWGDDAHDVHRRTMLNSDCDTCHQAGGFFPVRLFESVGGAGFPPIACVGCHGRDEDSVAPGTGDPIGSGAGLRQHHWNTGIQVCLDCHDDSDPAAFTTAGENVAPLYYFTPDADHPNKPTDACSPNGEENCH